MLEILKGLEHGNIPPALAGPEWGLNPWTVKVKSGGDLIGIRGSNLRGDGQREAWRGKITFDPLTVNLPEESFMGTKITPNRIMCAADTVGNHMQVDLFFFSSTRTFSLVTSASGLFPEECYEFEPGQTESRVCKPPKATGSAATP